MLVAEIWLTDLQKDMKISLLYKLLIDVMPLSSHNWNAESMLNPSKIKFITW